MKIKKALVPIAGLGTRFLPLSKVLPKELWPLVDKPVIQYIIEELSDSGIKEIVFINRPDKKETEKYFKEYLKNSPELEQILKSRKFCLNVLPRDFISKIKQFKISDWKKKFDAFNYELSPNGHPVLDDCIGYLDFALVSTVDTGDHSLFIGRIEAGAIQEAGEGMALSTADYDGVYRGSK